MVRLISHCQEELIPSILQLYCRYCMWRLISRNWCFSPMTYGIEQDRQLFLVRSRVEWQYFDQWGVSLSLLLHPLLNTEKGSYVFKYKALQYGTWMLMYWSLTNTSWFCWIVSSSATFNVTLWCFVTHLRRGKMVAIFQTTCSNAFSWMKMYEFRLRFHWSLFLN